MSRRMEPAESKDADDDGYDSIDEDAELELSCALHDLALRVKTFEENMKDRFHAVDDDDDDDEIAEDIPEMDSDVLEHRRSGRAATASPKHQRPYGAATAHHNRRRPSVKAAKQQADEEEEEDDELYDDASGDGASEYDGESEDDDSAQSDAKRGDWDLQEQTEELSELRHNIAVLLQGIKAEAKALESSSHDLARQADTTANQ